MNLSPHTIDNYRETLFQKLDLKSRTGLVLFAIKNKLIKVKVDYACPLKGLAFFGYFCNHIPDYEEALPIKANVICDPKSKKPDIISHEDQADHPFIKNLICIWI